MHTHISQLDIYISTKNNNKTPYPQIASKNNARERKGIGSNVSTVLEKGIRKRTRNGRRGIRGSVSTVLDEKLKQVHFQMQRINQVHNLHSSFVVLEYGVYICSWTLHYLLQQRPDIHRLWLVGQVPRPACSQWAMDAFQPQTWTVLTWIWQEPQPE
jgi:hypothetical protein